MKQRIFLPIFLFVVLSTFSLQAQVFESTNTWGAFDHSAWKIEPQSMQNYVIAGNRFFEPSNTTLYISEFSEFAQFTWTRSHNTGLAQGNTFWKSFCKSSFPVGYFLVTSGGSSAYALITNATGMKMWDKTSTVANGTQFGGVCPAVNGGFIAVGSSNAGQAVVCKFDGYGNLLWTKSFGSFFPWTVKPAGGGYSGYVLAGTRNVVKIDANGNVEWSATLNLPVSPDGSQYTYTEFEEILPLPTNDGFIVTGSCFSNSHSGAYTARFSYTGAQVWSKVNETVNTALAGTPVCWINNAVVSGSNQITTSWRNGPVSTGGNLRYQHTSFTGTNIGGVGSMGNTIPVQEAFMTRAHQKFVVGGTRGGYSAAYAYAGPSTLSMAPVASEDRDIPEADETLPKVHVYNSRLEGDTKPFPGSRTFYVGLNVYPNPSSGLVSVGGTFEPDALLRVTDMQGRLVLERNLRDGERLIDLNLSGQNAGVYTVTVIGTNNVLSQKVVIQ